MIEPFGDIRELGGCETFEPRLEKPLTSNADRLRLVQTRSSVV